MYFSHLKSCHLNPASTNRESFSYCSGFWIAPSGYVIRIVVLPPTSFSKPFTGAEFSLPGDKRKIMNCIYTRGINVRNFTTVKIPKASHSCY